MFVLVLFYRKNDMYDITALDELNLSAFSMQQNLKLISSLAVKEVGSI